jgi:purine nucleosidase/pyrimidine-specific ribonucleoside hydrolase
MSQSSRPVHIDTDPGIDDALALFLAWGLPGLRVEAISTVAGNVSVDLATVNVFRILDAARPALRPRVARGAAAPLRRSLVTAAHVHGEDGLGNLDRYRGPDGSPRYGNPRLVLERGDGADLILESAGRFGRDLIVIALGPLTNVALALQRDPGRLCRIGRLVIMGGAVTVAGNITPAAEFNFHVDPDAAQAVLAGSLPVEIVPLDVTRRVTLGRTDLDARLPAPRGPREQFLEDVTAHGFAFGGARGDGGITLHDPLAVAVAAEPSLVGLEPLDVQVETDSELTRGLSLADRRPGAPEGRRPPNCRVALTVDVPRALALTLEGLCRACA